MNTELIAIVERTLPYLVGRIPDSVTQSLSEYLLTGVVDRNAFNIDARNRLRATNRDVFDDSDYPLHIRFTIRLLYILENSRTDGKNFRKLLRQFCEENNIPETT